MEVHEIDGITVLPPLCAEYRLDPVVNIKQDFIATEQGYHFDYHHALEHTMDLSFNKDSNFYLTHQMSPEDVIEIAPLADFYPNFITTYLAFNRVDSDPLSALSGELSGSCLSGVSGVSGVSAEDLTTEYILPGHDEFGAETLQPVKIGNFVDLKSNDILPQEYYFTILLKDGYNCFVFSQQGDKRYYLREDPYNEGDLYFQLIELEYGLEDIPAEIEAAANSSGITFQYVHFADRNLIRLYKQTEGQDRARILKLREPEDRQGKIPVMLSSDYDLLELNGRDTIRHRPQPLDFKQLKVETNVVNYEKNIHNDVNVDVNNSSANQVNNMLIHSEYYYLTGEAIPYNIMPLKNQQTDSGYCIPSNPWPQYSEYHQRIYNKLFTGTDQLEGTDKIYLNYSSTTTELIFQPGLTYFNFAQNIEPFERININDTSLIKCGAVGADRPIRADKIFKKQAGYKQTTRWGDPSNMHTGTWLCTWLSAGDSVFDEPVWMDRYYNPSSTGYVDALNFTHEDLHGHASHTDNDRIFNNDVEIYDERSKLTFEPGCMYAYYRIDGTCVNNALMHLAPYHDRQGFDNYQTIIGETKENVNEYKLNGKEVAKVNISDISQKTGEIAFNFDIDIEDWKKNVGNTIIGNYTNRGFSLNNMNDVSPFIFIKGTDGGAITVDGSDVLQDTSIRIYNNKFELINYVTNYSHIDTDKKPKGFFKHVIVRDLPDDIFTVMTSGEILRFNHSGVILATIEDWLNVEGRLESDEIVSVDSDDELIYILSHIKEKTVNDFTIHTYNTTTGEFIEYDQPECIFNIPVPGEFTDINSSIDYGRYIENVTSPPNLLVVKDDAKPYQNNRVVYLGYGDEIKVCRHNFWIKVVGSSNELTGIQENHDALYCFNTRKMELLDGKINTNNQTEELKLSIIDYQCDSKDNIWTLHSGNVVSKLTKHKRLLFSREIEGQELLSLLPYKTISNGNVEENIILLGKTVGGLQITVPIKDHPTKAGVAEAKASAWQNTFIDTIVRRPLTTEDIVPINDRIDNTLTPEDEREFDDTLDIIYPFVAGNDRFGTHQQPLNSRTSIDTTGMVNDGEYDLITEMFDLISTESIDMMYGNVIDINNGYIIEQLELKDFTIDSIDSRPEMVNSYDYFARNFEKYPEHNMNLKMLLTSNHDQSNSIKINTPIDIKDLAPGKHNITININNTTGNINLYIDGIEYINHNFDPGEYYFSDYLVNTITSGATPYLNDTLLVDKIRDMKSYVTKDMTISNFNIYTKCLNHHDILFIMRNTTNKVPPVIWSIPNGMREMIEGVDRVFNHSLPSTKSGVMDIRVRNSKITTTRLQNYLTNKIRDRLDDIIPAGTDARNIIWSNQILS